MMHSEQMNRSLRSVFTFVAAAMVCAGCGANEGGRLDTGDADSTGTPGAPAVAVRSGMIDVTGGRVWYRIYGDGDEVPLLGLHGGPGMSSVYMTELQRLADRRPVVIYDQLGSGNSDRPDDLSLWTVERFVEELQQVRTALGLDRVHLLGHSWGTMLAVEYMQTNPAGIESLMLISPAVSVSRWLADANRLKAELPEQHRVAIETHEAAGTTDSPEYVAATTAFYEAYLNRSLPWRAEMDTMFETMGVQVYTTMWGPSEFHATGVLKTFERADALRSITIPTLLTAGRYDEATPETVQWYADLMPNAKFHVFEESAHMAMLEEPEAFAATIRSFLERVESGPEP